jgi:transaldolase
MPIFLDTANIDEIARFSKLGILRGVTTNPSILLREDLPCGLAALEARVREIAKLIMPHPVAVEVLTNEREEMVDQARQFAAWSDNVVVKIPIHGPQGELHNLEVVRDLETRDGIRVNVTATTSAQQGLLAALSGASYVSLLGGRISDIGGDAAAEIARLRRALDRFELPARVIVGSCREACNVIDWIDAGAFAVTVPPVLLDRMLVQPASKEIVGAFLRDAGEWLP